MTESSAPRPATAPTLDELADMLTLREAADLVRLSTQTLRRAIKAGELPAWIPRGKDRTRLGRGPGYMVRRADLQRWFAGK